MTVTQGASTSKHEVTASDDEAARYSSPGVSIESLVEDSFRFLLEREPKESILRHFSLSDIERYFPEFGAGRAPS